MKVKELAELAGVSVRTLHHYDEIGLLIPDQITEVGYRLYSDHNLETLQQILFFRELDMPLKEIKQIICDPAFDRQAALEVHRRMLLEKRERMDKILATLDRTIQHSKGEIKMTNKDKFEGFDFSKNPYEQEARERWGDKAVDQSNHRVNNLSKSEQEDLSAAMNEIYRKLAVLRQGSPESEEAQQAIKEWFDYLNKVGSYSLDAFKGLGELYTADVRFTKNIDQFGEGLAVFLRDAMAVYADNNK